MNCIAMTNYIRVHDNALSLSLCSALRHLVDQAEVFGLAQRTNEDYRKCIIFHIPHPNSPTIDAVFEAVKDAIRPHIETYRADLGGGILGFCTLLEQPGIIRYKPETGDWFHPHADCWSTDSATRQLSVVAFLNDVDEGGETVFPALDVTLKPKAGQLVLFPSAFTHVHESRPPVSGPKYTLVSWLHFEGKTAYNTMPL